MFTTGDIVPRIPVPRDQVPDDIRGRFSRYRTIYRVLAPIEYIYSDWVIRTETFVLTDFASIPVFLAPYASRVGGPADSPAVIHDLLYRCGDELRKVLDMTNREFRRYADRVFLDALIKNGLSRFRSRVYYYAVRVFGGRSYTDRCGTNPTDLVSIRPMCKKVTKSS